MRIEISREAEARLTSEAQRQAISVEALLERLINELLATAPADSGHGTIPALPTLHLGPMGALHRRDIYDDGR
jgi:hypothetical protein